jgi:hypothetical protein
LHNLLVMPKMAVMVKPSPEEEAEALHKLAKDLGCDESDQRFWDVLFTLGTHEVGDASKPAPKRRHRIRPHRTSSTKGSLH